MASSTSFSEMLMEQVEDPLIWGLVLLPIVLVGTRFLLLPRRLSRGERLMHLLPWAFIAIELGAVLYFAVTFVRFLLANEIIESASNALQFNLVLKRLEEPVSFWALLVPVGVVLLLYMFIMAQRNTAASGPGWLRLLSRISGPPWVALLVGLGCALYLGLGLLLKMDDSWLLRPQLGLGWFLLLGPVVAMGFFYIGCMYHRDAHSVGFDWAAFLGLSRSLVYIILAVVFLLPAFQKSETKTQRSKLIMLLDVSGSMLEVDDLPEDGQALADLLTRQDKVIRFLTADQNAFLKKLIKTNPVTCYRFGQTADETPKFFPDPKDPNKTEWSKAELDEWLKIDGTDKWLKDRQKEVQRNSKGDPDKLRQGMQALEKEDNLRRRLRSGTNLGDSLLQVFNKESANMLQGIIVVSDGQKNQGKEQSYNELRLLAEKNRVPFMCIGVGKFKPPISIRLNDLEAPKTARPDDPFTVQVPVLSQGLKGKEYEVILEISRVEDARGNAIKGETYPAMRKKSTHKDDEADRTEYEINVEELKKIKAADDKEGSLEGTWEFKAKVARDKREVYAKPYHVSQPVRVKVTKKKIRALIFAGGPSKEYQFVKNLFYREAQEKRMEVGVYLQTAQEEEIDLDDEKPQLWMLDHFPDLRVRTSPVQKPYTLFEYDLVIAFDPDWTGVAAEARNLLKDWVVDNAGGLVVIGGPVNTEQLTRPDNRAELKQILDLYPVHLGRFADVGLAGLTRDKKYPLKFPGANAQYEFLKLNEAGEGITAGWNEFFYGTPEPGKDAPLERGFFSFFPVKSAKAVATTIATFPETGEGGVQGEVPYLVAMNAGSGKSVYIGSDEMWRLRMYREQYHERFWLKLARFVGSGNLGRLQKYGESNIPERMTAGDKKRVEYKLFSLDRKFFPRDRAPELKVYVTKFKNPEDAKPDPDPKARKGYDMKAKSGRKDKRSGKEEDTGWFMADVALKEPGKYEFELKIPGTPETLRQTSMVDQPNPELDNVKPDHLRLYKLAEERNDYRPVQLVLNRVVDDSTKRSVRLLKPPADEADKIGPKVGESLYFDLESARLIPDLMITDKDEKETKGEAVYLWDQGGEELFEVLDMPIRFSWVMLAIVILLSAEWLTRKLLKLA